MCPQPAAKGNMTASPVLIRDDVYGCQEIGEPVLLNLLWSRAVNRLRHVSQAGATSLVRPGRSVSRYEHSVGVMLLTRALGGSVLEQAAGLLQDVSHTAFSHTIDYVFGDKKEEFHESIFRSVVMDSDLPEILSCHGLDWQHLFEPSNLRIVDVPAPGLCADRIDYTLRDLVRFGHIEAADACGFVDALSVIDDVVVCTREDAAEQFVRWYAYLVEQLFMNPLELYVHDEFAAILRDAIRDGLIGRNDLVGVDSEILNKLKAHPALRVRLDALLSTKEVVADDRLGGHRIYSKARTIDPPVLAGGKVVPLSYLRPEMGSLWTNIVKISKEGLAVRRVQ
jgi:HD superfamily phosphohydrolase